MEVIKKTVLQAVTTGTTGTGGIVIIPDLSKIYYFKISLTQEARDLGFFEAYFEPVEPVPPVPPVDTFYFTDSDNAVFTDSDGAKFLWE